jgi:hypothetical protein
MTNHHIEFNQAEARLQGLQTIPSVGEQILPRGPTHIPKGGVDLSADRNESNAARDLRPHVELNYNSPAADIEKEMADREARAETAQMEREEYARQFKENALRGGYQIELDDQYRVIRVTPVKKRFGNPDSVGGR